MRITFKNGDEMVFPPEEVSRILLGNKRIPGYPSIWIEPNLLWLKGEREPLAISDAEAQRIAAECEAWLAKRDVALLPGPPTLVLHATNGSETVVALADILYVRVGPPDDKPGTPLHAIVLPQHYVQLRAAGHIQGPIGLERDEAVRVARVFAEYRGQQAVSAPPQA